MGESFCGVRLTATGPAGTTAAGIFARALARRFGRPADRSDAGDLRIVFAEDAAFEDRDAFEIRKTDAGFDFCAKDTRGLIYAAGLFLRKTAFRDGKAFLTYDVRGRYAPQKPIRGHQLGYRPCSNTYDAWDVPDFERYMEELMFFGMNTVEFIPFTEQNELMKRSGEEMTALLSEKAHAMGLDVSLWIPNGNGDEADELARREALFGSVPYIDTVFVPGSDPGDLPAETLIGRCNRIADLLKRYHPHAQLWVSAQAPHNAPDWGERFLKALSENGSGISGVITGPNRAFPLEELRRRLPETYPIRFYPDITHNLRCEHPVHFEKDDWHYAFAACLSRECVNPRPVEYTRLFHTVAPYTVGSVTYSDGVNDDVNKAVWCALEWDASQSAADVVEDYARAYLYDYDTDRVSAAILLLEKNWEGTPLEKRLDFTAHLLESLRKEQNCWRFCQLWFRALCDLYIKDRMLEDSAAYGLGAMQIRAGAREDAIRSLQAKRSERLRLLKEDIVSLAVSLYDQVGMQLSTQYLYASGWERGATLDTLDNPITDREWLLYQAERTGDVTALQRQLDRNTVREGECYFSFALHGTEGLWELQDPDFYMNFQGDRPDVNDGSLPVCLQKVFDHLSLRARLTGFVPGRAYRLTVTYFKPTERFLNNHKAEINGVRLASPVFDEAFTREFLPEKYKAYTYIIPAGTVTDGVIRLTVTEPAEGFQTAEFRITFMEETA